jgi:hypothetical protein
VATNCSVFLEEWPGWEPSNYRYQLTYLWHQNFFRSEGLKLFFLTLQTKHRVCIITTNNNELICISLEIYFVHRKNVIWLQQLAIFFLDVPRTIVSIGRSICAFVFRRGNWMRWTEVKTTKFWFTGTFIIHTHRCYSSEHLYFIVHDRWKQIWCSVTDGATSVPPVLEHVQLMYIMCFFINKLHVKWT